MFTRAVRFGIAISNSSRCAQAPGQPERALKIADSWIATEMMQAIPKAN